MQPNARGYFGDFGGRFVPEVLIDALDSLEREMTVAFADPQFWHDYEAMLRDFVGRPSPLYRAERYVAPGGAPFASQTRRPQSHRRAQDQQHRRPGAARAAHGQAAIDCRDRRWSARRRDGDGRRKVRFSRRRLHGRGRRRASSAQRVHHEAARRNGALGRPAARRRSRTRPTKPFACGRRRSKTRSM